MQSVMRHHAFEEEPRFDAPQKSLRPDPTPSQWYQQPKSYAKQPMQVLQHSDCLERFWGLESQHPQSPVTLLLDCNLVCAHNLPTTGWLNNKEPTCDTYARLTLLHARPGEEPRMTQWCSRDVGDNFHPRYHQRMRFAVPDFCDDLLSEGPNGTRRDLSISNILAKSQNPTQGLKFLSCFVEILVSSGARGEEVIGFARIPNEAFVESLHNDPKRVTLAGDHGDSSPTTPRRELRWKGRSMELRLPLLPDCSGAGALGHFGVAKQKVCRGRWASKVGLRRPDEAYVRIDIRTSLRIDADVGSPLQSPLAVERPLSAASTRALSSASEEEPIFSMTAVESEPDVDTLREQVEDLSRERELYSSPLQQKEKSLGEPEEPWTSTVVPTYKGNKSRSSKKTSSAASIAPEPKMEEFFQNRMKPTTAAFISPEDALRLPARSRRKNFDDRGGATMDKTTELYGSADRSNNAQTLATPSDETSDVDELLASVLRKSLELKHQSQGTLKYVTDKYGLKQAVEADVEPEPRATKTAPMQSSWKSEIFKSTKYSLRPGRFGINKKVVHESIPIDWSVEFGDRTTLGLRRFDYPFQYMFPSEYWKYRQAPEDECDDV